MSHPGAAGSLKRAHAEGSVSPPALKRKQQSTTTNAAVSNFFTPLSKKQPTVEKVSWQIVDETLLVGKYTPTDEVTNPQSKPRKIAAFDFDSTLIASASGKRFGRDANDWKWWHGNAPGTLRLLVKDGYLVSIFSNQAGINLKADSKSKSPKADQKRLQDFKGKATAVLTQLDLPITIYAATQHDRYRKPRTGMWEKLLEDQNIQEPSSVDLDHSFFVGDAGGRAGSATGTVSKDFSCSDRNFASNVGISFQTPEEYFLHEEPRPFTRDFDPARYVNASGGTSADMSTMSYSKLNAVDVVMFCGSPGAGKSSFYWKYLRPLGYERVNQDILKSREKCLKAASEFLSEGKSVAVDNTNADSDARAHWVNLAKKFNMPIRCVLFTASTKLCEHNDAVRALNSTMNPEERAMLPKVAFTSFASRYRPPKLEEGFQDITKVEFTFQGTEAEKLLWTRYWI